MSLRFLLSVVLLLTFVWNTNAHPGIGIVKDKRGNIYYTDLVHVWKQDKNGNKSIAVRDVHTHELYMDAQENLVGDNLVYTGGDSGKYYHYIWWLDWTGKRNDCPQPWEGYFMESISFVRDERHGMYLVLHNKEEHSIERVEGKAGRRLAKGDFEHVQWLHYNKGSVYFVNHDTLFSLDVSGEQSPQIVSALNSKSQDDHATFGIWSDTLDNLYVANASLACVQQISKDRKISVVYHSPKGWIPTGGVFDDSGILHVLEYSKKNEVRVVRTKYTASINTTENKRKGINDVLPVGVIIAVVAAIALRKKKRKTP